MLREAIEELKKHCLDHECEGCEFYDSEIEQCALILPPCDWEPAWASELRPCPFCGGKAKKMDMGYPHCIYCTDCGAKVHGGTSDEADSVEAWNRRAKE